MKFTKFAAIALLTAFTVTAFAVSAPFDTWITKLTGDVTFNDAGAAAIASGVIVDADISASAAIGEAKLDPQNNAAVDGTDEGLFAHRIARFIYDEAVDGGAIAAYGLGVTLPAGAVIVRSYFKIITQFVDGGSGTVALSCEDANNIKTATDITGSADNAFVEGESDGAAANFQRDIAAACEITATVAGAEQTAGKLVGWVEYVVED